MTQTTPERKPCGTCGSEYTVTANGTIRHHLTDNPEFQAGPDSRKCRGAGERPAGAAEEQPAAAGAQCRLCKHPVQLTDNGRARSHLTPEQKPRKCPGGSDFPLGQYPDMVGTTDGLVATLRADCEHVPVGQCYGCYGEAGNPVSDPELNAMAEAEGTGAAPWGVDPDAVAQPTMADQLKATPFTEALARETSGVGTVLDAMSPEVRSEAERFMDAAPATHTGRPSMHSGGGLSTAERERLAAVVATDHRTPEQKASDARMSELTREAVKVLQQRSPEQKAETAARMDRTASAVLGLPLDPELNHEYTDPSGTVWVHPGPEETCQAPDCVTLRQAAGDAGLLVAGRDKNGRTYCAKCGTDNHRCPGCGTDVPHGVVACTECTARVNAEKAERQAKCTHPDGFTDTLSVDGREVPACEHCGAVAPASKLPQGETDDGRPCDHADELFGLEDGKPVCVACGTECTHPDGFKGTADVPGSDDQDRVVSVCEVCGTVAPEDAEPVGPDPELPNCPHPLTHRAGCGCPDDDSRDPADAWRAPADILELMPEDVRELDALRLNCRDCGHPVTPLIHAFDLYGKAKAVIWVCEPAQMAGSLSCDRGGHECKPDTRARLGDLDEGDYFVRGDNLMRLTERESSTSVMAVVVGGPYDGRTGELKNLDEMVERAPEPEGTETLVDPRTCPHPQGFVYDYLGKRCPNCGTAKPGDPDAPENDETHVVADDEPQTGPVRVGELEHGDVFLRRGTAMRVTSAGYGLVEAIVVDNGPHAGRTGELKNPDEVVERIAAGTKEQETKECTDDRTATSQRSSAASTTRTTALAPGSPRATRASAQAVSSKSESVTSSAPTARAAGNGRGAAVTTDQASAAAAFLGSAHPTAPAASGPQNSADAAAQFLAGGSGAHGEKETKRDRFGRYLIPHPDTGKETAWTRSTTFAKSISDTYALSQWGLRMALLGATQRPDIVQRAHGKHVKADKSLLDELTAELKNAAGDKVAANLGTAMHSFTEMADRAWHSPGGPRSVLDQVPPDCREMVETYIRLLEETGLEPVPHLIEFTTVVKQYGVAGTSDNCYKVTKPLVLRIGRGEVRLSPGEYVIGDKKTGKDLDYGWQEIAIQLATYAQGLNTAGVWDRHEEEWHPKPLGDATVRLDAGIVLHLPVDKEAEKQPAVYGVDLESGWNAAVLCERVRAWRKVRSLASPVMVSEAETFAPARPEPTVTTRTTVRPPSLMDKARAVTSKGEASAVWKEAKTASLPDAEVDELVAVMQSRLKELAEPGG